MGNSCFGLKERLMKRLRPLPTVIVIRTCLPQRRSRDFRVVVLGSAGVGKSALVQRWVRGNFREAYLPTIEDTYRQALGCSHKAGALHITDTTGGRRYRGLQRLAIARGHAFILVYSVTKKQTLEELKPLYELIRQLKGNNPQKCPIILVGNKCDESHREVSEKEGAAYASEWNCAFLETSAKMNINVQELFQMLINFEKKPAAAAAAAAAGAQPPQKKSQIPKTAEKLLGKCIIM
ncbi:GTP-binding protein Di-Ras3 [Balaenoptera musculus]|uniref:GTP-binding protein Di-Ras3 n=1 Tax=Balaenoptera musculus TaxID=9771 RepID=A0A8B8Y0R8_BALMU|nr:GTP-binding protein Di-Ras3 [Balaenoptera musculus]XP_036715853.1 GTP-binding protein Di-Ras3 [Balaenoptera musculus]XP_036715860.1 GTP-binding protein Di-Ras3 [Balaenoptera musculus]XP_036715871.1 GTP-binding protein Di-Ras3 [Balaenoptera musculus]XP_036715876.1 GTP-binding protein Di-Ras3 [Balaenoptera musculus]XP_036715879.1 GTP-binding protein Di-Ras3 [Balaenoptera musculus]XP_036715885.1 GTP-binding protein Di-Ras3 [Balaenoptera musculus]